MLVEEGARWMINSGTKVNIWGSKWLPDQNGGRVWSPIVPDMNASMN